MCINLNRDESNKGNTSELHRLRDLSLAKPWNGWVIIIASIRLTQLSQESEKTMFTSVTLYLD
jgi:hypothetical protein